MYPTYKPPLRFILRLRLQKGSVFAGHYNILKTASIICQGIAKTYHTIRDLVAPSKPTDLDDNKNVTKVQEHYNQTPVLTVQRYKFTSRVRQPENQSLRLLQPFGI